MAGDRKDLIIERIGWNFEDRDPRDLYFGQYWTQSEAEGKLNLKMFIT